MKYVKLLNGVEMPILGFGVYQIPDLEECERVVLEAIEVGYRSIDTAQAYENEEAVGNAIKKSGVDRKEFFITTKVWISNSGYEKAKTSIDESLKKLQTELEENINQAELTDKQKRKIKAYSFIDGFQKKTFLFI